MSNNTSTRGNDTLPSNIFGVTTRTRKGNLRLRITMTTLPYPSRRLVRLHRVPTILNVIIIRKQSDRRAFRPSVLLYNNNIRRQPRRLQHDANLTLLPTSIRFRRSVLRSANLNNFLLSNRRRVLAIRTLSRTYPPRRLFSLVNLRVTSGVTKFTTMNPNVMIYARFLRVILTRRIGKRNNANYCNLHHTNLTNNTRLRHYQVTSNFPNNYNRLFPSLNRNLPRFFRVLFYRLARSSSM